MRFPKGDRRLYGRFTRWLFELYKKWWVQYIAAPVLLAAPPALVTGFYNNKALNAKVLALSPWVADLLTQYAIAAFLFASLYSLILLAFAKSVVKSVDARGLNVEGLLMLIAAIDSVVGSKARRFAERATNMNGLTRESVFDEITQPTKQIAEIVRAICELFNLATTDKKRPNLIRVVLATINENNEITGLPIYYPEDEPVRSTVDGLNDPSSAIRTAARTRKTIIIRDIAKELEKPKVKRKFADTGNDQDNIGSLICYPVLHNGTKRVPFVISIHCEDAGYFKEGFVELYEHTLQRFALRLSLEYSLLTIKEKLSEPNSQQA